MNVTELMDVNAGDEQHRDEDWWRCRECGRDVRVDYEACWQCGASMEDDAR